MNESLPVREEVEAGGVGIAKDESLIISEEK